MPVYDSSTFVREGFGSSYWNTINYTEPYHYYGTSASQTEIDEYNKMKASVEEYNGFYIGRYEASNNGSNKAECKANKAPWNQIQWSINGVHDLDSGAVGKARQMYPDSSSKKKGEAVSTLCYGVQWDETVRWLEKNYPGISQDSTQYGNNKKYNESVPADKQVEGAGSGTCLNTGISDNFKTNNIYDLCGNLAEFTMESYYGNEKVHRGTYCVYSNPVSYRGSIQGTFSDYYVTFRPTLYIK